jgi:epoxyqueuosine reductase
MTDAPVKLAEAVKAVAREAGFDDAGLARVSAHAPDAERLEDAARESRLGPMEYMWDTLKVRQDLSLFLPGAQTVLMVVKNYYTGDHGEHHPQEEGHGPGQGEGAFGAAEARISRYAWGGDYHNLFRRRLRKVRKRVQELVGDDVGLRIFNDTAPVLERAWAERAGLGFIGKSTLFIHRRFGTWTFLGGMAMTSELPADAAFPRRHCGTCTACMDACPTQAFDGPWSLNANRCLTTWNVERPLHPDAEEAVPEGHGWALGCDVCQEVCPWNRFQSRTEEDRFFPRPGHVVLKRGETLPQDLAGTPLARPGLEGLTAALKRAWPPVKK